MKNGGTARRKICDAVPLTSPYGVLLWRNRIVRYNHPDWGVCFGRVLHPEPCDGLVLVQDRSPGGAREWWPVDALEAV